METEEIVKEVLKRYKEAQEGEESSYKADITREKGMIYVKINDQEFSITRQALADTEEVGDRLASDIWHWIQP